MPVTVAVAATDRYTLTNSYTHMHTHTCARTHSHIYTHLQTDQSDHSANRQWA